MGFESARRDFHEARRRASLEQIMARLTGKSVALFSYDEVRQRLKARDSGARGLRDIPLDAIVGSEGRYTDFTRSFLPRRDSDMDRWARVKAQVEGMTGLPPIEVYQVGQVYFVRDGNHRVSVARELGATHIQAYVTEVRTKVPLSPDDQPADLILKGEYADFLEHTHLDQLRPHADLSVTVPGQYDVLEEHIEVHRYYMGLEQQREIPYQEAVTHWYDQVYLPVAEIIRERGILRDFPERTETDLYLWISEHRAALEERLGWEIKPEAAAASLTLQASPKPERLAARIGQKLLDLVVPDELEDGPSPGEWRKEHESGREQEGHLFADILVPLNGTESGWRALEQALGVARREAGRLLGLHVVSSESQREGSKARTVQAEFDRRCQAAGVPGKLAIEVGEVARRICERTRWTDLMVVSLAYPPPSQPVARLGWGFRTMIRRCAAPIMAVPGIPSPLERVLLAYDGSRKADEALYIAAYLAGRWKVALAVLTVTDNGHISRDALDRAQNYLTSHDIEAAYLLESGPAPEAILKTAEAHGSNLVVMGSYGHNPVLEVVLGSSVDQVLRSSQHPTLICR